MNVAEIFDGFLSNLSIYNSAVISHRYGELTAALNKRFRDTESKEANTLRVGSFARGTGIRGISDLDILYLMPRNAWETYKDGGQRRLLEVVKAAILKRYPRTEICVDRLVVTVTYTDFHVEVQPVFEQEDLSFLYPDTRNGGAWKVTKPRQEMAAIRELDEAKNGNLRRLCKMVRAWRNHQGLEMGGLLIDTLAYNYFKATEEYDSKGLRFYDHLSLDFFNYLSNLPEQGEYAAPGSRQRVRIRAPFQPNAKVAYELCLAAIESDNESKSCDLWRTVYGRAFPAVADVVEKGVSNASAATWRNTEEFIEDRFPVDIREQLRIDCEVSQAGFRVHRLREMLYKRLPLRTQKTLRFFVTKVSVSEPFVLYWKVLNRGEEARRRDNIRGQVVLDAGKHEKIEPSVFQGHHRVECYCVKDGVVVARDRIDVPIIVGGAGE